MTLDVVLLVLIAGAIVLLLLRLLGPWLFSTGKRARMHGPVPFTTPSGGGTSVGWALSMLWSVGEKKREERYEYLRQVLPVTLDDDGAEMPVADLPRRATDVAPGQPPAEARDHQPLTLDGRQWWAGKRWVSASRFIPPSAPRSLDGREWWDGEEWRAVPGLEGSAGDILPRRAPMPRQAPPAESWLLSRRPRASRRPWPRNAPSDRSDPPPDWLLDED